MENTAANTLCHKYCKTIVCVVLLLIVVLAVEQAVPAVTGPGQRTQTHRALDARLVPGALVDAQQEAVGDGSLAACAQLPASSVLRTCREQAPVWVQTDNRWALGAAGRRLTSGLTEQADSLMLNNHRGPSERAPEYHFSLF